MRGWITGPVCHWGEIGVFGLWRMNSDSGEADGSRGALGLGYLFTAADPLPSERETTRKHRRERFEERQSRETWP